VVQELATFAADGCVGGCGSGSTVGPDGALYVTGGKAGSVLRVDPDTGEVTTFASGLPPSIDAVGIGGAMDVAFLGHTAYVLVTLVGPFFGQPDVVDGIYRIEDDGSSTAIADIGAWSTLHPPVPDFFIASGVQYAMQPYRGGFLVTDGHHNRVLRVKLNGEISEVIAFGDIVPTGLAVSRGKVYMAQAGPIPHLPENGKIVSFKPKSPTATEVASGASLLVDVEFGPGHRLYALSQGLWDLPIIPENEGMPASPNSGKLVKVDKDGGFTAVVEGLDRPTSLEFIGNTAFVVTLTGKVIRIDNVSRTSHDNED
jgi:sugar lactone lactonase YvrE